MSPRSVVDLITWIALAAVFAAADRCHDIRIALAYRRGLKIQRRNRRGRDQC